MTSLLSPPPRGQLRPVQEHRPCARSRAMQEVRQALPNISNRPRPHNSYAINALLVSVAQLTIPHHTLSRRPFFLRVKPPTVVDRFTILRRRHNLARRGTLGNPDANGKQIFGLEGSGVSARHFDCTGSRRRSPGRARLPDPRPVPEGR